MSILQSVELECAALPLHRKRKSSQGAAAAARASTPVCKRSVHEPRNIKSFKLSSAHKAKKEHSSNVYVSFGSILSLDRYIIIKFKCNIKVAQIFWKYSFINTISKISF